MKSDPVRIKSYLYETRRKSIALQQLMDKNELIENIRNWRNDFERFIKEIEANI